MATPILEVGSGFGSAWTPTQVGDNGAAGGNAAAIAAVNEVPFRDADEAVDGVFYFGIIADHINGISKIDASCENGARSVATTLTFNSRTQCFEYQFGIRLADFATAGQKNIWFEAFPAVNGLTRIITISFYVDPTGAFARPIVFVDPANSTGNAADSGTGTSRAAPWLTLKYALTSTRAIDGAIIKLMSVGGNPYPQDAGVNNNTRFITMQPDDGLTPAQAKLATAANAQKVLRLQWKNLLIPKDASTSYSINSAVGSGRMFWFDRCTIATSDGVADPGSTWAGWVTAASWDTGLPWVTNCTIGPGWFRGSGPGRWRWCTLNGYREDAFDDPQLIYNCVATGCNQIDGVTHGDVVQWTVANAAGTCALVWNLKGWNNASQGIFADKAVHDLSIINVAVETTPDKEAAGSGCQLGRSDTDMTIDHVLIRHCTFANYPFAWNHGDAGIVNAYTNCLFENSECRFFSCPTDQDITIRGLASTTNSFSTESQTVVTLANLIAYWKTAATVVDTPPTLFVAYTTDATEPDFTPSESATVGLNATVTPGIQFDAANNTRAATSSIGAYAAGSEYPPAAPSALTATAASSTTINLVWDDNSSNETGFELDFATDAEFSDVVTLPIDADATSYAHTGLNAGTTYYYRIRAVNAAGDSAASNTADATTEAGLTPPTAPSDLTATAVSPTRVDLTWTDNSDNETAFVIERKEVGGEWSVVHTT